MGIHIKAGKQNIQIKKHTERQIMAPCAFSYSIVIGATDA